MLSNYINHFVIGQRILEIVFRYARIYEFAPLIFYFSSLFRVVLSQIANYCLSICILQQLLSNVQMLLFCIYQFSHYWSFQSKKKKEHLREHLLNKIAHKRTECLQEHLPAASQKKEACEGAP